MPADNGQEQLSAAQVIARRLYLRLLTRGRVVIVGLGGVGSILVQHLVVFLAGLAGQDAFRVLLCDGDEFDSANAYRTDIPAFANKAQAWMGELSRRFCVPGLSLRAVPEYVAAGNVARVIQEGDCCFLCCDNHATRKLVGDRVGAMRNAVLISGGNDGISETESGTYGNVQIYVRSGGGDAEGAPVDRFHPEIAHPADRSPEEMDCLELAAAGAPQLGFANLAVASAMCNALLRLLAPPEHERMYDEVCFDLIAATSVPQWIAAPRTAT